MGKIDIKSMHLVQLQSAFMEDSLPKYRAQQVYEWLHGKNAQSFLCMQNLPKTLREQLDSKYFIAGCKLELKRSSKLDDTAKYLFCLHDGEYVESVLMQYKHGATVCISSQVGCRMGCSFCATGQSGFVRNLLPSEMLSQIAAVQEDAGLRISNVVLMGMGEPLDNYENLLRFLELVGDEKGLCIGMRHISLSTCGIVDKIYDLAERKLQLTLSVSLHAPNDDIRRRTMPIAKRWSIDELLKACRYYGKTTGRRISFEYAMIDGVNDSQQDANELAERLRGILCHINLIPVNNVTGAGYTKSGQKALARFENILAQRGFTATVRRTLGADIEASCGQLRGKTLREDNTDEGIL